MMITEETKYWFLPQNVIIEFNNKYNNKTKLSSYVNEGNY